MDLDPLAAQVQALLAEEAGPIAWQAGCCQRQSPLAGAALLQTLVLGCLAHPEPKLEDYAQVAAALGRPVTPQAIAPRFTAALARALEALLAAAVRRLVARNRSTLAVLNKFAAVEVHDSTTVTLPDSLEAYWRGCDTATGRGGRAALKVQARLDLVSGRVSAARLEAGRDSDRRTPLQAAGLGAGTLHLRDLGYFDLEVLRAVATARAFFLSRLQDGTAVFDAGGRRLNLGEWLGRQRGDVVDVPVTIGVRQRLACRLVAVRVPAEVAARRRQRVRANGRKKGYTPSREKLALCDWNLYVTNAPAATLSVEEVLALARARWQIECLFRQWKSDGGLARVRSAEPWRIVGEVLAKLIALLVQHAVLIQCTWQRANRSLRKAAKAVRRHAGQLIAGLHEREQLLQALRAIGQCLLKGARVETRRKHPSAFQVLTDPKTYGYKTLTLA
jgi:Transposase DDE domain